ncbi:hypothetical protein HanOQP8_Chr03g0121681 [Helianthus annuus]|nr:hypothetical protein HanOQP8_Chr03g0121681 [Helianthus annuus]
MVQLKEGLVSDNRPDVQFHNGFATDIYKQNQILVVMYFWNFFPTYLKQPLNYKGL